MKTELINQAKHIEQVKENLNFLVDKFESLSRRIIKITTNGALGILMELAVLKLSTEKLSAVVSAMTDIQTFSTAECRKLKKTVAIMEELHRAIEYFADCNTTVISNINNISDCTPNGNNGKHNINHRKQAHA